MNPFSTVSPFLAQALSKLLAFTWTLVAADELRAGCMLSQDFKLEPKAAAVQGQSFLESSLLRVLCRVPFILGLLQGCFASSDKG